MKKFVLMLCIIFLCGFISADLCMEKLADSHALLDIEMYEGYANADIAFKDVFWNILYERIKLVLILGLLCFTPMKESVSVVLVSAFSFAWGFFFMTCISQLGMAGIVVGIASVLPHSIFYGGIFAILIFRKNKYSYYQKDRMVLGVASYIAILFLFAAGCVIESVMGTHFIPWVIRLSLI